MESKLKTPPWSEWQPKMMSMISTLINKLLSGLIQRHKPLREVSGFVVVTPKIHDEFDSF